MTGDCLSSQDYRIRKIAVVFDFDNVLFNSRGILTAIADRLQGVYGLFPEIVQECYPKVCNSKERFLERLADEILNQASQFHVRNDGAPDLPDAKTLTAQLADCVRSASGQLVFPDALTLFEKLRALHNFPADYYILTKGDPVYQRMKIAFSGIGHMFISPNPAEDPLRSRIIVTPDKEFYIWELSKTYDAVVFVEDVLENLITAQQFLVDQGAGAYPLYSYFVNRSGAAVSRESFAKAWNTQNVSFSRWSDGPNLDPFVLLVMIWAFAMLKHARKEGKTDG